MTQRQHYIRWTECSVQKYTVIRQITLANQKAMELIEAAKLGAEVTGVSIQRVVWNDHC